MLCDFENIANKGHNTSQMMIGESSQTASVSVLKRFAKDNLVVQLEEVSIFNRFTPLFENLT